MKTLLKKHFGYDEFRPLQEEIITNVLDKKDSFVLMPTGGGKSLCYQLPALKFDGLTLVISPLIALMKDQVDGLQANGIPAEFINSSLSFNQISSIQNKIRQGEVKILYVAPERLALGQFQEFLKSIEISLIAIDEAHCISEWGHDFRPDYRNLKTLKEDFPDIPIIALTATATKKVQKDILHQLNLEKSQTFISSFNRKNLEFLIIRKRRALDKLIGLLSKHKNESVIIYCFSRKETENLSEDLKLNGFKALPYHAGLSNEIRKTNQDLFIKDEAQIIVATIAFGMGIDKPDIRLVVHYTFPKSLEGYYQEVGRAGRDGLPSKCVLFYSYGDKMKHDFFLDQTEDLNLKKATQEKLDQVIRYCQSPECRRQYLLNYFGEEFAEKNCQACDNCLEEKETFNATEISQKIISCIIRTGSRFGKNYIADVLRGSKKSQITGNRHDKLPVFGIVSDFSKDQLMQIIQSLLDLGFLRKNEGDYPTLAVSKKGAEFLKNKEKLELKKPKELELEDLKSQKRTEEDLSFDHELFEKLRVLRKQIADRNNVPPFVIFTDVSLREMAYYLPQDRENFSRIQGVGEQKLENLGEVFMDLISAYAQEKGLSSIEVPHTRRGRPKKSSPSRQVRKSNTQKTKEGLEKKLSIKRIAEIQGFTEGTIVRHISDLIQAGESLDIDYLMPKEEVFTEIKSAFEECGYERLKPIYEHLNEKYSYDEIRLVGLGLESIGTPAKLPIC